MTSMAILHPGRMGAAVAGQAVLNGVTVRWCPVGRSPDTAARAQAAGLIAVEDAAELVQTSDVVISLCPPAAAESVADEVAALGFSGLYVEANAISPQRVARIGERLTAVGARVVDGCVFGAPPGPDSQVRLYLAGRFEDVQIVAALFSGTQVIPKPMRGEVGNASAIKIAQSSYQKASRALSAVAYALADHFDVVDELRAESANFAKSALTMPDYLPSVAARAWRWGPEMGEVAETLRAAGLPDDFARSAQAIFELMASAKDEYDKPLDEVLAMLLPPGQA